MCITTQSMDVYGDLNSEVSTFHLVIKDVLSSSKLAEALSSKGAPVQQHGNQRKVFPNLLSGNLNRVQCYMPLM